MPKIETSEKLFFKLLGKEFTDSELENIFPYAKAELDGHENGTIKIELNDTNRPDLWSAVGLSRLIKNYFSQRIKKYSFFSDKNHSADDEGREIVIGKNAKNVRAYSCGFVADGKTVDEDILKTLIQSQEKLCFNFGRKRRTVAMGIYKNKLINFPVHYDGVDPDKTHFVPLHMDEDLTLREICEKHEKGREYGYIVKDKPFFPFLFDSNNQALSFPPVINSSNVGEVEIGDKNLFLEVSGPNLKDILLCANIMACDMSDLGFKIHPVTVIFDEETEFGKKITVPYYFQDNITCPLDLVYKTLGEKLSLTQIKTALKKMGLESDINKGIINISCPPYRNDFLHAVDVVEDIMIGCDLNSFEPVIPKDFTVGRLSYVENLNRKIKDIMIGMSFQEMIFNYLGSLKEYVHNMNTNDDKTVLIANPMSENYAVVRPSVLPSLLKSEASSLSAVYPHRIYETGKIVLKDDLDNSGTKTINSLGILVSDRAVGFNDINSMVNNLMYLLNYKYELNELDNDTRFIIGRCAKVVINGVCVGVFGEIHPQVLENFGCTMPTVCAEFNLDLLPKII